MPSEAQQRKNRIALRSVIGYVTEAMFEKLLQKADVFADKLSVDVENRYRGHWRALCRDGAKSTFYGLACDLRDY